MKKVSLELRNISKRFGALRALDSVSVQFSAGEIHALLGENGAGKTTLMNVLYGLVRAERGTITLSGKRVSPAAPEEARRLGIGMVHQHFTVVDRLSTAENVALSLPAAGIRYRPEHAAEAALRLARRVGLDIGDPHAAAGTLAVGTRQRVEILKALAGDVQVLILDEPTAVLTPGEVAHLFAVLRRLREEGRLVIFITHKLREARAIADRVTVLRRGRVVRTGPIAGLTDAELAVMMVGSPVTVASSTRPPPGTEVLRLDGVRLHPGAVHRVELRLRAGEVFGVVGVDGNGQAELFGVLAGLVRPVEGAVCVRGRAIDRPAPARMLEAGIGFVPPDRRADGLVPAMSVTENLLLNRLLLRRVARGGLLRRTALRRLATREAQAQGIPLRLLDSPAAMLSGGNQQRLIVARALAGEPDILVAVNPTRGLDVAAAQSVYETLDRVVSSGRAVVLISTDLEEVLAISDRLGVLFRYQMAGPLARPFDAKQIGLLMAGVGTET